MGAVKRRPHILLNAATTLSLVLAVVAAAMWARSLAVETILVESRGGQLLLVGIDATPGAVRETRRDRPLEPFLADIFQANPPVREHRALGFWLAVGADSRTWVVGAATLTLQYYWVLGVPYWALTLLALVLPAAVATRSWRSARRTRSGHCRTCGYDLRATPGRCPECGATPTPPT
jgi:hypothetical protein